ncbi:MAG: Hsp20/alpha crystallin family protein [Planctomycetaceae bacterium]|nr:Hsp20/alpha crystallin family protein [Planctomycetaceae bacterium]
MLLTNRIATNLDPWRVMRAIEDHWGPQLNGWLDSAAQVRSNTAVRMWTREGEAVVEFDLPGVRPDQIDVSVHKDLLSVELSPQEEMLTEGERYHLRERNMVARQQIQLPFAVDPQRTDAEYQHGVLRVTLHQPESHRPARIAVKGL